MDPTKKQGWTQVLRKGRSSCSTSDTRSVHLVMFPLIKLKSSLRQSYGRNLGLPLRNISLPNNLGNVAFVIVATSYFLPQLWFYHQIWNRSNTTGSTIAYPSCPPGFGFYYCLPFMTTWFRELLLLTLHDHLGSEATIAHPSWPPGFGSYYCLPFMTTWFIPSF